MTDLMKAKRSFMEYLYSKDNKTPITDALKPKPDFECLGGPGGRWEIEHNVLTLKYNVTTFMSMR